MAKDRRRSGNFLARDGKSSSIFPSTFSGRQEYERISEDGNSNFVLDHLDADISRSTKTPSRQAGSPVEQGSSSAGPSRLLTSDLANTPPAPSQPTGNWPLPGHPQQLESTAQPIALPGKARFSDVLKKRPSLSTGEEGTQPSPVRDMPEDFRSYGIRPHSSKGPEDIGSGGFAKNKGFTSPMDDEPTSDYCTTDHESPIL